MVRKLKKNQFNYLLECEFLHPISNRVFMKLLKNMHSYVDEN